MKAFCWRAGLCAALLALSAYGQEKGIEPDWDIRPVLKEIAAHAQRLIEFLDHIDAQAMLQKGASDTYAVQLKDSRVQAQALATEALALANSPEKLSADLKTLFRMESLERMLTSLEQGIRRYQNPALADLLDSRLAENSAQRDRFQRYILDLAGEHEQEYQVMDREAQRCRGMLARQPRPAHSTEKK